MQKQFMNGKRVRRDSKQDAKQVIEQFLPDPDIRHSVLRLMVDCIRENARRPATWGVTLYTNEVRLNVGGGVVGVQIGRGYVGVSYLPVEGSDVLPSNHDFARPANSRFTRLTHDQLPEWLPKLHAGILAFVKAGTDANESMNGRVQGAHSPGVLRYMEEELQLPEPLPNPVYPSSTQSTSNSLSYDEAEADDQPMPASNAPLNQILFGPPGTGKTYNTVLKAVQILHDTTITDMGKARPIWEQLRRDGQIEFVTFHQSYGYEDFIEGLRPNIDDDEAGQGVRYEIRDGVLKRIALRALAAMLEPVPQQAGQVKQVAFSELWDQLMQEAEEEPEKEYPGLTAASNWRWRITPNGRVHAKNVANPSIVTDYSTSRRNVERVYEAFYEQTALPTHHQILRLLGVSGHHHLTATVLREIKRIKENLEGQPTSPEEPRLSTIEDAQNFLDNGYADGYTLNLDNPPRYVLIMDEINRGNISKIFGELITLIEEDKRVGGDVALDVTLPISGDRFALPPNLYLLGTMNTADKSIALVDIALRRRFQFTELMPDFGVCPNLPGEMQEVLSRLNERITLHKDRDHQIGHAYFMSVTDNGGFNRVWQQQIRPLLAEYFHNDWDALMVVLGEGNGNTGLIRPLPGADNKNYRGNSWQWHDEMRTDGAFDALAVLVKNYGIAGALVQTPLFASDESDLPA